MNIVNKHCLCVSVDVVMGIKVIEKCVILFVLFLFRKIKRVLGYNCIEEDIIIGPILDDRLEEKILKP